MGPTGPRLPRRRGITWQDRCLLERRSVFWRVNVCPSLTSSTVHDTLLSLDRDVFQAEYKSMAGGIVWSVLDLHCERSGDCPGPLNCRCTYDPPAGSLKRTRSTSLTSQVLNHQNIGGEGGIRTHGPLRVNGFQDRRYRPLSHLSTPGMNEQVSETCLYHDSV